MKKAFLILVLLGIAFAGISIDQYTLTKSVYKPGEPGVVTITISNPVGSERVTGIGMTLETPPEFTVTNAPRLPDIDAGGSTIVSIPFKIKEDAKPGIYTIYASFTGIKGTSAVGTSDMSVNSVSIPVTVVNEPELSFALDKKLLTGIDDVTMTITNNGGSADNVKLSIAGPISLYGSDSVYIGSIATQKTVPLTLDSRNADDGVENIGMVLTYEDALGMTQTLNASIRITVRKERLDLTFTQVGDIITKKESTLSIAIKNDGAEDLKDVRLAFTDSTLRLKDSGELKFGDLKPGESATASGPVVADLPPGVNLMNARLSWIEKDVQKDEARQIPLTITSDADVGVYLEAKPLPLTMGSEHTISVLVSNLGSYGIDNVDVSIQSPALRSVDISDRQYIGGLLSDDFSTVQFLTQVNATAPGTYPVQLTINYRDQSGEWKSKIIEQNISVYAPTASGESPLPLLLGIGVVAVLVWFFKFRKK